MTSQIEAYGLWQSKTEKGSYQPYPTFAAAQLEKDYKEGKLESILTFESKNMGFRTGDSDVLHYRVDFQKWQQVCVENPDRVRTVRRVYTDEDLTPKQLAAIDCVEKTAHQNCGPSRVRLCDRFGRDVLQELETWVGTQAPVIIHIKFDKKLSNGKFLIDALLEDTHYRNLFETKDGCGSTNQTSRASWEDCVFNNAYKDASPFERPKYGTINLTNNPKGVKCAASQYGSSFLVLKQSLRWRCTLTSLDSSDLTAKPYTTHQFMALLEKELSHDELEGTKVQNGTELAKYKEVQIHGPVCFKRDISEVVVNSALSSDIMHKVEEFGAKHSLQLTKRPLY